MQKYHERAVPRIGGVAIVLAAISCVAVTTLLDDPVSHRLALFLLCSLPAALSGFAEDLTKRVSPRARLICALIGGMVASRLMHAVVPSVHVPLIDFLLSIGPFAFILSSFAIAGVTNAVNIIDGFNGLASGVSLLVLSSLALIAYLAGDHFVFVAALMVAGSVMGFFVWNFPRGAIFLGDGGAYFIGYAIAVLTLVLISENPTVSPWYGALVLIYPVFETLFTIFRRKFVQGTPVGKPDGLHLHTLVHRRITRSAQPRLGFSRNSLTSPYLWVLCLMSLVPASVFWDQDLPLVASLGLFLLLYVYVYSSLVKFRALFFFRGAKLARPRLRRRDA
ncbi:MraY family glycosyltransferase [Paraburkholderia ginsengiterrae]|uniref:MraY family glycosyltransferase n=1 Tax=Paraburkholderia ginsengiterrae TaxID=1462993 RepID=UPI001428AA6E|nr:glycosyltransferase [Paraburkholderia ginsengiterrae]